MQVTATTKKKKAFCLLANSKNKIDNSITAGTKGFVQHRFHFLPVGQNESLVIGGSLECMECCQWY